MAVNASKIWQPAKVLSRYFRALQKSARSQVRSARPKVIPDGKPTGGSLAPRVADKALIKEGPWSTSLKLSRMPFYFYFFLFGAGPNGRGSRQDPRPVSFALDAAAIRADLERDLAAALERRIREVQR